MPTLVDVLQYKVVLDDKGFTGPAREVDASVNQMAGSIGGKLTGALALLAAAFAAVRIGDFLKDATLTAARTEVLGTVLNQVGRNAGVSEGQLALLEEQVKSLGITTQGARESIVKFIQSGLPLAKVAELARVAQDSAIVAETSSAEALDRLVRGIQTQQIELLRTAGVFVSIEQELSKFAKTVNKTANELTPLEKQTVILNAVLAQGEKLAGNYEAAMGNVGKQITSLPRLFEELQNAVGTFFLPILEEAVGITSRLLKDVTDLLTAGEILEARRLLTEGGSEYERQLAITTLQEKQQSNKAKILAIEQSIASLQNDAITSENIAQIKLLEASLKKLQITAKETERLLGAFTAQEQQNFIGPIDNRAEIAAQKASELADKIAKREEERAKRAAERGKELAKTITVGGDIAEGMDKQWKKFVDGLDSSVLVRKMFDPTAIAQAFTVGANPLFESIRNQIQNSFGSFKSTGKKSEPLFDILDIQQQIADAKAVADITKESFRNAFDDVFTIASSVLRNIGNEAADVFGGMLASIGNLSTGNIAAGIAGVVDSIFSIFGAGADRLVLSQRDLIRAIEDWQKTVSSISDRDKAEQQDAITQALQFAERTAARGENQALAASVIEGMLSAAGISTPENATLQQLVAFMQALQLSLSDTSRTFESIIGATTAGQRTGLVTGTTGADEALRIINTLTDIFDLNLEEQQALLQTAFDDLIARGLLSDQDKADFFSRIEGLGDSIDSLAEKDGATQVERSIARVSERQADSLISIMNTLDLHLVDGLNTVINYLQGLFDIGQQMVSGAAVGGGGTYTIEITNNFSGGNQAEIESTVSKAVEKGIRAVGGTRIGSR